MLPSLLVPLFLAVSAVSAVSAASAGDGLADAVALAQAAAKGGRAGVLVMAHGGSPEWNADVEKAVEPIRKKLPVEIAFGMADAATMQRAVYALESRGVTRVAVVRLFVSGDSFLDRTLQIVGLAPGAPAKPAVPDPHAGHGGHSMELWRLDSRSVFAVSGAGLMDGDAPGEILAARAKALSRDARRESVLILAHGPGDDAENLRWLSRMQAAAAKVRALGFKAVRVETLREDWPEKRADAEARIRAFVGGAAADGRALVLPYRLSGFGPYREVLAGLDYAADGRGFLPHPSVAKWLRAEARAVCRREGWVSPL